MRWLGTEQLTWRDLLVIVAMQPRDSAMVRVQDPENHAWGLAEHLLAEIADMLHVRVWQSGKARKADQPKPIPRPGVDNKQKVVIKHEVLPANEMAEWLGGDFATMFAK